MHVFGLCGRCGGEYVTGLGLGFSIPVGTGRV